MSSSETTAVAAGSTVAVVVLVLGLFIKFSTCAQRYRLACVHHDGSCGLVCAELNAPRPLEVIQEAHAETVKSMQARIDHDAALLTEWHSMRAEWKVLHTALDAILLRLPQYASPISLDGRRLSVSMPTTPQRHARHRTTTSGFMHVHTVPVAAAVAVMDDEISVTIEQPADCEEEDGFQTQQQQGSSSDDDTNHGPALERQVTIVDRRVQSDPAGLS